MRWKVTDFKGNSVEFDAGDDLQSALDIAYDEYRVPLWGNAEHWEISNDAGESFPRDSEYDWDTDVCGYREA